MRASLGPLLAEETRRFCVGERGLEPVLRALDPRATAEAVETAAALLSSGGKVALFAAIALAANGDARGLDVLTRPHDFYCTNSCVEVGLALCARAALGDLEPPLAFINASMLGPLAEAVGAHPPPLLAPEPNET